MEKNSFKDIFIGVIAALVVVSIIIFTFETGRSFLQLIFGFIFFIIPITFLSSFKSKIGSFILASFTFSLLYICFKLGFEDLWTGALIAAIIGGSAFYFRVRKAQVFDVENYVSKAKEYHENK